MITNAQASAAVNAVYGIAEGANSFHDDPITVASGCGDELAPIVYRHARKESAALLQKLGVTWPEVCRNINSRITPYRAYCILSFCETVVEEVE